MNFGWKNAGELFLMLLVVIAAIALEAFVLVELARWLQSGNFGIATMPIIAIVGIFELIGTIVIVVILFKYLGLASPDQALGLPDGSVRAFLALSLLVLFSILTVFLYGSLVDGTVQRHIGSLPADYKAADFTKDHPQANNVTLVPSADRKTADLYWEEPRDQASADYAKNLLTLIGTLMTAVVSFYFGANTVASAVAPLTPAAGNVPTPKAASPNPLKLPASGVVTITASGTNLNDITSAKLVNTSTNSHVDSAGAPKSNATSVSFDVSVAQLAAGSWEIQLTDKNNKTVTVPGGIILN